MMMLKAASGLNARPSLLALLLVALQGLGHVDTSRVPMPQTPAGVDRVSLGTATRNTNSPGSVLLNSHDCPFLFILALSRGGSLQGAESQGVSGRGPPAPSVAPPETGGGRKRREQAADSADPLCLHTQRGRCSLGQKEPEKEEEEQQLRVPEEADGSEQSRAVSKETIASSSDDPFKVVQPPGGEGSPRSVGTDKALTKKRTAAGDDGQALRPQDSGS